MTHEQRLITKEHIAMHTHFNFKALYSSTLVIKVFKANMQLYRRFIFIGKHTKREYNEITRVDSHKRLSKPTLAMYQLIQTFSTHEIKEHEITYKAM